MDYIVEQHHSPQILLKQVIQLMHPQGYPTHALLIDDDETWLQVMTARLESFGFKVTASVHPETFWDTLEDCRPDLLILDIKMPKVSGLELCKVLRSHPDWQSIPVMFVSTATDCPTQMGGIVAGADEFISKQLDVDVIVRRIMNRLARFPRVPSSKFIPAQAKSSRL
ncbi:MAG: response regulator [Acaryochloridaceae cyanobacterium RL_2_7]|nr:response regulator [Acaryochloridaceae cyanobacterium RL_2_7]